MRKAAITGELLDRIVDALICPAVGEPFVDQFLDQLDHLGDIIGRMGVVLGRFNVECMEVIEKSLSIGVGVFSQLFLFVECAREGFIIDVGDVLDLDHLKSKIFEGAAEQIFEDVGAEIADMGIVVNRWATSV